MNYSYLTIPYASFHLKVEECIQKLAQNVAGADTDTINVLSNSFADKNNGFLQRYQALGGGATEKVNYLQYNLRIIDVCDYIKNKNDVDIAERMVYAKPQKMEVIMVKLYELNDGQSYPLELLFQGNAVTVRDAKEIPELADALEKKGYIKSAIGINGYTFAAITPAGVQFINENLLQNELDGVR